MSTELPTKPRVLGSKSSITIVRSKYNEEFTQALLDNCLKELKSILPNTQISVIETAGSFEVPMLVEHALKTGQPNAVIALGLIIRGETQHGDLIAASITHSLQEISVRHVKPVIHEVLLVNDKDQAYARCIGSDLNRGIEAARAVHAMLKALEPADKAIWDKKTPF